MEKIILDLKGIKTYWQLHELFREVFRLPDYYGHNMDALWDCLNCYYDHTTMIFVKNCHAVAKDLQPEVELMRKVFRDLQEQDGVEIRYEDDGTEQLRSYLV